MSFFRKIGNNIMNVGEQIGLQAGQTNTLIGKQIQVGAYKLRVESRIGEGGYAIIYLVRDVDKGTTFALKHFTRLDEQTDRKTWVEQEARIMAKLRHCPYILRLLSVGFTYPQDKPGLQVISDGFYVMDLCSYGLVDYSQQRNWDLEEATIFEVITQTCQALKFMHQQNPPLTHRDVKAENILRHPDNRWVLCDFGSSTSEAKIYNDPYERSIMEDNIRRFTTPPYRAPEMWDLYSRKMVGPKADVWAVGCMLYLLLYKQLPFTGESGIPIINGSYSQRSHKYQSLASLVKFILVVDPDVRPDIIQLIAKIEEAKQFSQRQKSQQQSFQKTQQASQQQQFNNFANFSQQPNNQFPQKAQNSQTQQQQKQQQFQAQQQKPKIQEFANFDMPQPESKSYQDVDNKQQAQQQQMKQENLDLKNTQGNKATANQKEENGADAFAPLFDAFQQNTPEQVREQLQSKGKQGQVDKQGMQRRSTDGQHPKSESKTAQRPSHNATRKNDAPILSNIKGETTQGDQEISMQNLAQNQGGSKNQYKDIGKETEFDSFGQFGATFGNNNGNAEQEELGFSDSNPFKQTTTNDFIDIQQKDIDNFTTNQGQPQDPFFASTINNNGKQANEYQFQDNQFTQQAPANNTYNDNMVPNVDKDTQEVKPVFQDQGDGQQNESDPLLIQYQELKEVQKESKKTIQEQQTYIESLERDLQDSQNTERVRLQKMNFQNQELTQLRLQVNEQVQVMDERSNTINELLDKLEQTQIENITLKKQIVQLQQQQQQQQQIPQRSGSYTSNQLKYDQKELGSDTVQHKQGTSYNSPSKYNNDINETNDQATFFNQDKLNKHNQQQEEQHIQSQKSQHQHNLRSGLQQGLSSLSKQQNQQHNQSKGRSHQQQAAQQHQHPKQPTEHSQTSQGQSRIQDMSRKSSNVTDVQNMMQQQQQGPQGSGNRQAYQLNQNLDPSLVQKHITKQGGLFWDKYN